MKKVLNWIVYSSANGEKYSRSLKAGLLALAPTIALLIAMVFGVQVTQDSLVALIGQVVEAFGAFLTVIYLVAKIYNTVSAWFTNKG